MPECSVIIPTRDRLPYLQQTLRSALAQRDVDHEVIVVPYEGCTDGTLGYLESVNDPRVRVYPTNRSGMGHPRNLGLRQATAEWVALLDDDDLWAPDKLRKQLDATARSQCDWAYTGIVSIDARSKVIAGSPPPMAQRFVELLPYRSLLPTSVYIWRRETLGGSSWVDPDLVYAEDWDLALRLLRRGAPAYAPGPLVAYREHHSSVSGSSDDYLHDLATIEENTADLREGSLLPRGPWFYGRAGCAHKAGRKREALRLYLRAGRLGDRRAIWRAMGVFLPRWAGVQLRRRYCSDASWMQEAELWLHESERVLASSTC